MCYPVCGMVHIKEPLLLIGKSSPCGGGGGGAVTNYKLGFEKCKFHLMF